MYGVPVLFLPRGRRQASAESGVSWCSLSAVGTSAHPSKMWRLPTALSDTASLRGRTGRLRRTVRNPLRSDRFLSSNRVACQLNVGIPKLRVLSNVGFLPSDGAYPRPEGRGIAPVQRITPLLPRCDRDSPSICSLRSPHTVHNAGFSVVVTQTGGDRPVGVGVSVPSDAGWRPLVTLQATRSPPHRSQRCYSPHPVAGTAGRDRRSRR